MVVCASEAEATGSLDLGRIYLCFYAVVSRFLHTIFDDNDFRSYATFHLHLHPHLLLHLHPHLPFIDDRLHCQFRLFQHLLRYHSPHLAAYLEACDLYPEHYATPWYCPCHRHCRHQQHHHHHPSSHLHHPFKVASTSIPIPSVLGSSRCSPAVWTSAWFTVYGIVSSVKVTLSYTMCLHWLC